MKKIFLALCAPLALSACVVPNLGGLLGASPAPLNNTTIDDKALRTAWQTFDVALDGINLAIDACSTLNASYCAPFKPGSPQARKLADLIDATKIALNAAEHAAAAGSTKDYAVALAQADAALVDIKLLLKKG